MREIKSIRTRVREMLQYLPDRGKSVKRFYWKMIVGKRFVRRTIARLLHDFKVPDPDTIYWIDPKRIEFHTNLQDVNFMCSEFHNVQNANSIYFEDRVFDLDKFKGAVVDGDWDLSPYRFTDLDVYKSFEQVVRNRARWQDTAFYRRMLHWTEIGHIVQRRRSRADVDRRCAYLDRLLESIRKNGYRLSADCEIEGELKGMKQYLEEVTVNIGRNGQYLFQEGRHRLSIALLLGVERIPVKVLVRHTQWQALREELMGIAWDGTGWGARGYLYQPCLHPDLADIPSTHACEDRYAVIQQNLVTGGGRVLDIGANLGYFCHRLEDLHFDCIAVESSPEIVHLAEKLRTAEGKHFRIVLGDILNTDLLSDILSVRYDVVLALNIFHHFIMTPDRHENLIRFLEKLDAHTIYFEPHIAEEELMSRAYANYPSAEFVAFVMKHGNMTRAEPIYRAADGRTVYKLQR